MNVLHMRAENADALSAEVLAWQSRVRRYLFEPLNLYNTWRPTFEIHCNAKKDNIVISVFLNCKQALR